MRKFNWQKAVAAFFAVILMIGFTACEDVISDLDTTGDVESIQVNYDSDNFFVMDAAEEILDFQAGDTGLEFSLKNDSYSVVMMDRHGRDDKGGRDDRGRKDNDFRHKRTGIFLGSLLRNLDLDETQMTAVKEYMSAYFKCRWEVFQESMEDRMEIMEWANAQRKALIEQYRNDETGEYTKEELRADLIELHETVKERMMEIFDQEAYCDCLDTLLTAIDDMFEDGSEEQAAFNEWYAQLEGPCFETTEDDTEG